MNPQKLLEQFLGPNVLGGLGGQQQGGSVPATRESQGSAPARGGIGELISGVLGGGGQPAQGGGSLGGFSMPGGSLGGFAAGGLLGVLLGQKKIRNMAGGLLGYGGAAALGALAHRAYQNWQAGQQASRRRSPPRPMRRRRAHSSPR